MGDLKDVTLAAYGFAEMSDAVPTGGVTAIVTNTQASNGQLVAYAVVTDERSGDLIGVAHIGSFTAYDFSDQDKRLLAAMATRATSAISQHLLRHAATTRARQQEAVAKLGLFALETVDLQRILQRAVEVVVETLGVDLAKILELVDEGRSLILRAGVGWNEGVAGRALVDAGRDSQAGYTLLAAEPVVVEDLRAETRFRGAMLRGLWTRGTIDDAAQLNALSNLTGNRSVGKSLGGWYLEGGYDLASLRGFRERSLTPYLRYEKLDTQRSVPAGFARNPASVFRRAMNSWTN